MRKVHLGRRGLLIAPAAVCLALGLSPDARAFNFGSGDWTGSWDTTLGYGQGWRTEGRNCALIAIADGGCGYGPNIDNGDLNYGKGTFTEAVTGVTEFSLKYKDNLGVFVRGSGLYDFYVMGNHTERTPLTHDAKDVVGSYTRLLDAFGYARFNLGSMPSELRLGRQVVDWGESLFIPGGLNQVDYFDVTALQVPGAEVKQALLPDESAVLNLQLTKNLSTQLIYLFDWHEDIIEPTGAYFSTNDIAGAGGNKIVLGFGAVSDQGVNFTPLGGSLISDFQTIPRLPDERPSQSGQFGVNFKLFLPNFGQGTQLGFYFLNYTSRLPVISFQSGSQAGFGNAFGAVNAVAGAAQALAAGLPFAAAVATGAAVGQSRAAALGGNLGAATATEYATIGANTLLAGGNVNNQASSLAANEYARTEGYVEQFPQDIRMLGLSFNTEIQKTGTALQGEVAYRHNVPLQLDLPELIYASLTPFETGIAQLLGEPTTGPGRCVPASATPITGCNQFGLYGLGQTVQGYELKDMWHFDVIATQIWANVLKASQALLIVEAGADYVPGLPNEYSGGPEGFGLRFGGPGTLSGNPNLGGYPEFPAVNGQCLTAGFQCLAPGSAFASSFAWGYVVAGHLEYDNVIGDWSLTPHLTWSQDVSGNSPGPGGAFLAGRYASTAGITASVRQRWELDVSYTHYGGAGQYNLLGDRDFVAASVKFSF
ncbi:MAG TPA: DUF1302 domain-containing protein [Steroidobacteraceae bacterium]